MGNIMTCFKCKFPKCTDHSPLRLPWITCHQHSWTSGILLSVYIGFFLAVKCGNIIIIFDTNNSYFHVLSKQQCIASL